MSHLANFYSKASEGLLLCVLMNKTRCLSFLFNIKSLWTVTGTMGEYLLVLGHQGDGLSAGSFVVLWSFPVWHVPGRVLLFTLRSCVYSPAHCLFSCATMCSRRDRSREALTVCSDVGLRLQSSGGRTSRCCHRSTRKGGALYWQWWAFIINILSSCTWDGEMSLQKRKGVVLICAERWRHWVSKRCPSSSTPRSFKTLPPLKQSAFFVFALIKKKQPICKLSTAFSEENFWWAFITEWEIQKMLQTDSVINKSPVINNRPWCKILYIHATWGQD